MRQAPYIGRFQRQAMAQLSPNRQVQSIGIGSFQLIVHSEVNGIRSSVTVQTIGKGLGKSAARGAQSIKSPARKVRLREVGVTGEARDSRGDSGRFEASRVGKRGGHSERAGSVESGQ